MSKMTLKELTEYRSAKLPDGFSFSIEHTASRVKLVIVNEYHIGSKRTIVGSVRFDDSTGLLKMMEHAEKAFCFAFNVGFDMGYRTAELDIPEPSITDKILRGWL